MPKYDSKLMIFMENCSSSMDENEKTMKSARHPWMKMKKR